MYSCNAWSWWFADSEAGYIDMRYDNIRRLVNEHSTRCYHWPCINFLIRLLFFEEKWWYQVIHLRRLNNLILNTIILDGSLMNTVSLTFISISWFVRKRTKLSTSSNQDSQLFVNDGIYKLYELLSLQSWFFPNDQIWKISKILLTIYS